MELRFIAIHPSYPLGAQFGRELELPAGGRLRFGIIATHDCPASSLRERRSPSEDGISIVGFDGLASMLNRAALEP